MWKKKAESSQFYKNAINTWTVRDVNKISSAIKNKLNYVMVYSDSNVYYIDKQGSINNLGANGVMDKLRDEFMNLPEKPKK